MRPAASLGTLENGPLSIMNNIQEEEEEEEVASDDDKDNELRA
jgi:hypothetical protein